MNDYLNDCAQERYVPGPRLCLVRANRAVASDIWQLDLQWDGSPVGSGQFLNILTDRGGAQPLRRPLSIADCNTDNTTLTVLYRVIGAGTRALAQQVEGALIDVLGPLGHGFPSDPRPHGITRTPQALLIGGGVGIPPLYLHGKRLRDQGWDVTYHLGLGDREQVFWYDRFQKLGPVAIATDDGSMGVHGTVMELPQPATVDAVFTCGPTPMLRAVKARWQQQVPTFVSLEERMACGTGACYACVVPDAQDPQHQYRACFEGPVFDANQVEI